MNRGNQAVLTHNLYQLATPHDSSYHPDSLNEFDEDNLEKMGVEEIWYWYERGSYQGDGQILMRKGNLYDVHCAGHCSCYGPTEHASFKGLPLSELILTLSDSYLQEVALLLAEAERKAKV